MDGEQISVAKQIEGTCVSSIPQCLYTFNATLWEVLASCSNLPQPCHEGAARSREEQEGEGIPPSTRDFLKATLVSSNDPEAIQAFQADRPTPGGTDGQQVTAGDSFEGIIALAVTVSW